MIYGRFNLCRLGLVLIVAFCVSPFLFAEEPPVIHRPPTVALLDDGETAIVPLIEAKLLANNSATWVERSQIEQVLKEQKLQAAFSGDAVKQRSQLGKLLKCDLLVLVRTTRGLPGETAPEHGAKPPEVIECVVCETKHGLRLHTAYVPKLRPAEVNVNELADLISQGLTRWRNRIVQVFAVPPLVSDDLDFRRNYLQTAYARLIQQQLLEIPGTVVVELAEAQAIARELAVVGEEGKVDRNLVPFYIQGRYRHEETTGQTTVKFNLRLEHEGRELRSGDSLPLASEATPEWLQRAVTALVKTAGRSEPVKRDSQREAAQLAKRAEEFMQIGHWDEALALVEASLLLNPDAAEVRKAAVICCGKVRNNYFHQRVPLHEMLPPLKKAMAAYRRGMEHLETFLERNEVQFDRPGYMNGNFISDFDGPFWATIRLAHNAPPEALTIVKEMQDLRTETYLRIGTRRARGKHPDKFWFSWITAFRPLPERLSVVRKMIAKIGDSPELVELASLELMFAAQETSGKLPEPKDRIINRPEFKALLAELDQANSPLQRDIAAKTRQLISERHAWQERGEPKKFPQPMVDISAEFQLQPITFRLSNEQPLKYLPLNGISAGAGIDVVWSRSTIYIMKEPGLLKPIWSDNAIVDDVDSGVFDGKYVWCVVSARREKARILVIDPQLETTVEFKPAAGSPVAWDIRGGFGSTQMKIAPLGVGKVFVVGFMGRTWVGTANYVAGRESRLDVHFEARQQQNPDRNDNQPDKTVFVPGYLLPWKDASKQPQILIFPAHRTNPGDHHITPLVFRISDNKVIPSETHLHVIRNGGATTWDGRLLYFTTDVGPDEIRVNLMSVGADPGSTKVLATDVALGGMVWHDNSLHVLGKQWLTWNAESDQVRQLKGQVPWIADSGIFRNRFSEERSRALSDYDIRVWGAFSSQHFGLVLVASHGLCLQAILPPSKGVHP